METKMTKQEFENKVFDKYAEMIIKELEGKVKDWSKPWSFTGSGMMPINVKSGKNYNGVNVMLLLLLTADNQYSAPVYGTFQQFKQLGVSVKKGEKSFPVFLSCPSFYDKDGNKITSEQFDAMSREEKQECKKYINSKVFAEFNIDQTDMKESAPGLYKKFTEKPEPTKNDNEIYPPLADMIAKDTWYCKISEVYGNDAYYSISKDEIVLPERAQFKDGMAFSATCFHEMAHSTGAEKRLARLKPAKFGSKEYAKEELVAELTAAIVCCKIGYEKNVKEDSTAYIGSWLKTMKEDTEFVKTVLKEVRQAERMLSEKLITTK